MLAGKSETQPIPDTQPSVESDDTADDEVAQASSAAMHEDKTLDGYKETKTPPSTKEKGKLRRLLAACRRHKKACWTAILIIVMILVGLAIYPTTRYIALNTVGVRSSAMVTVIDNGSRQPLKNVNVQLHNAQGVTDDNGTVTLYNVRLGETNLVVSRRAFAPLEKTVTVGWGSNPLGEIILEPKGLQYTFIAKDFLSGKPIEKVEAISGDASAFSDKDGKIILTLDTTSDEPVEITLKADGYRTEKLTETSEGTVDKPLNMVPATEQAFISKRSGKYDLYKVYADGQGETLVLPGTGFERDDITLVPQPTGENVALVSTRDNQRGADGTLLSTLNIVTLADGKLKKLDTADRIQVVGWIDNTIIYIVVSETPSSGTKKQRLVSYNLNNNQKLDITSATYFNDVLVAGDKVYYAAATEADAAPGTTGFFMTDASGVNTKKLLDKEVWSVVRSNYDTITFSSGKDWFEYKLGSPQPSSINGAPADQKTRVYTNNPSNTQSLWVDERDGKGVLLSYDLVTKADKILVGQSGLSYPVRWLNDTTAVYRINNDSETADYVISVNGGNPKKIVNVTNTAGIDKWYYY